MKYILIFLALVFLIGFVSAEVTLQYDNENIPNIFIEDDEGVVNNYFTNVTVNATELSHNNLSGLDGGDGVFYGHLPEVVYNQVVANYLDIYNHSLILITLFGDNWYNHTIESMSYTDSVALANNDSWTSTYNATYDNYNYSEGSLYYNHTIEANDTIYSTYGEWWYNQTEAGDNRFVNVDGDNMTGDLNIFANLSMNGSIFPLTTLLYDIGSGAFRWRGGYFQNISADYINVINDLDVEGVLYADHINATSMNLTELNVENINVTTITSSYIYNPYFAGYMDMRADPWYLGGTDLQIVQSLIVDENISSSYYCHGSDCYNLTLENLLWYNHTITSISYTDAMALTNNDSWVTTYNATYDKWSHNETIQSNAYTDSMALANNDSWLSTYNETYDKWAYNQTLAVDTTYDYNQTTPAIDYTNSMAVANNDSWLQTNNATYDTWAYNQTTGAITYANLMALTNNNSWLSTFNESYSIWAYNESLWLINTYGDDWYNHTIEANETVYVTYNDDWSSTYNESYSNWDYNQTTEANAYTDNALVLSNDSWRSTYNESYSIWAYNESLWLIGLYGSNWYNHTVESNSYTDSVALLNNDSWLSTFNESYSIWAYNESLWLINTYGDDWYNHTIEANETVYVTYDAKWSSTYNATYDKWSHNETIEANSYTDNALVLSNDSWRSTYNESYSIWAYNESLWLIGVYGSNWYNHTIESNSYTDSVALLNNNSWLSTFNVTYDKWSYNQSLWLIGVYGDNWYNHTSSANETIFNTYDARWSSTFNESYSNWDYNETLISYAYTDSVAVLNNDSWSRTNNATYDGKADYLFTGNNFTGSGNFTTTGAGHFGDMTTIGNPSALVTFTTLINLFPYWKVADATGGDILFIEGILSIIKPAGQPILLLTDANKNIRALNMSTTTLYVGQMANKVQIDSNLTVISNGNFTGDVLINSDFSLTDNVYNHTIESNSYTDAMGLANNDSWRTTFNATYDKWAYNQTEAVDTTYNYNQTIPSISYTDAMALANNNSWLQTDNATYDAKADYNFTTNNFNGSGSFTTTGVIDVGYGSRVGDALTYINVSKVSIGGFLDVPLLDGTGDVFGTPFPNVLGISEVLILLTNGATSTLSFLSSTDLSSGTIAYNSTSDDLLFNNAEYYKFDDNVNVSGIIRATGDVLINSDFSLTNNVYNHTTEANSYTDSMALANNDSWLSTFNQTYNDNAYNHTIEANSYTDAMAVANNDTWSSTANASYDGKADYSFGANNFDGTGMFNTTGAGSFGIDSYIGSPTINVQFTSLLGAYPAIKANDALAGNVLVLDADPYVYRAGGNPTMWWYDGVDLLSISQSSKELQVGSAGATVSIIDKDYFFINKTDTVINDNGADFNLRMEGDTDADLFYVDGTNDRVGIGTDSPNTELEVVGNITLDGDVVFSPLASNYKVAGRVQALTFTSGKPGSGAVFEFYSNPGNGSQSVTFDVYAIGNTTNIATREKLEFGYTHQQKAFRVFSEAQGSGIVRPIYFYAEGNPANQLVISNNTGFGVGIGTRTPTHKFSVNGNTNLSGNVFVKTKGVFGSVVSIGIDSGSYPLSVYGNGTGAVSGWFEKNVSATGYITRTPTDLSYSGSMLDLLPSPSEIIDPTTGKLSFDYLINDEKSRYTTEDLSKPVYTNVSKETCWMTEVDAKLNETSVEKCSTEIIEEVSYPETKVVEGLEISNLGFNNRLMIAELKEKNEGLNSQVDMLKSELCKKDITYSWCK